MAISEVKSGIQTNYNPSFRGKYKKTEKGNDYYHTNSAVKIGATGAGLSALLTSWSFWTYNLSEKMAKSVTELSGKACEGAEKVSKLGKKFAAISGLLAIAGHLGASTYIDKRRNEETKKISDLVNEIGADTVAQHSNNVMLSKNNSLVHESNVGAQNGGLLGAGIGLITGLFSTFSEGKLQKLRIESGLEKIPEGFQNVAKSSSKIKAILGVVSTVAFSALGGWLLGKWSDNIANNDTYKNA